MSQKIKVLVVDDSKFIRTLFTGLLNEYPDIEVVGSAEDPYDAREKIKTLNPDVLTLDVEMPKMDGISFLEKIMKLRPMPVVMASTLTKEGADVTIRALELGAVDYVTKPSSTFIQTGISELGESLAYKIRVAANANVRAAQGMSHPNMPHHITHRSFDKNKIIAIGASTGGVEAIREVVTRLPENAPPVLITQHMPEKFTEMFAKRLDNITKVRVQEAQDNMTIKAGNVYIAPGNYQMSVVKDPSKGFKIKILDADPVSGHKPSVDYMFDSVANVIGDNAVGVILTGMGKDGAEGMLKMKKSGSYNIGQSKDSCVVYGMPRAANDVGAVDLELPVEKIADEVLKRCASN